MDKNQFYIFFVILAVAVAFVSYNPAIIDRVGTIAYIIPGIAAFFGLYLKKHLVKE